MKSDRDIGFVLLLSMTMLELAVDDNTIPCLDRDLSWTFKKTELAIAPYRLFWTDRNRNWVLPTALGHIPGKANSQILFLNSGGSLGNGVNFKEGGSSMGITGVESTWPILFKKRSAWWTRRPSGQTEKLSAWDCGRGTTCLAVVLTRQEMTLWCCDLLGESCERA
jgi:hypothetical protein